MTSRDMPPVLAKSNRWRPIAELANRFQDLPVWKVLVQHVPTTAPENLEHLASELDLLETEAWQKARSDAERRAVIDQAHTRNRTQGTDFGLHQAAAEAGAEVRRIWAPPNKFFPSASLSIAERNTWLARHPELRLYPRRVPGIQEVFHAGNCLGKYFFAQSTALFRSRLRVTFVKNGVETELETVDTQIASVQKQVVNEVLIPGNKGFASFAGQCLSFIAATDASNRRIVLRDVALYDELTATTGLRTLTTGLQAIDADGELVAELRPAAKGVFYGGGFVGCPSRLDAELATYRRIKLFDPTLPAVRARASAHLGFSRLTMPPHTAEIQIAFFGQRHPRIGRYAGQPFAASDREPLQRVLANMRRAKRLSDEIWIDTRVFKPYKAGHVLAGQAVAGGVTQQ